MSKVQMLPREVLLFSCKANAIIVPSEYGLSRFAADELMPLVGLAGREAIGGRIDVYELADDFQGARVQSAPRLAVDSAHGYRADTAMEIRAGNWRRG